MAEKLGATRTKSFVMRNTRGNFIAYEGDYNGALRFNRSFFRKDYPRLTAKATSAVEFPGMFNLEQTCGPRPVKRP